MSDPTAEEVLENCAGRDEYGNVVFASCKEILQLLQGAGFTVARLQPHQGIWFEDGTIHTLYAIVEPK